MSTNVSATSRQAGERSTTGSAAADDGRQKLVSLLRRPVVAGVVLFALYAGLSLLNDPDAYLGTDTGGKVASLDAMVDNGGFDPDVGYWAAEWDPEGRVHPFWYTHRFDDKFVQLSTLPMALAAKPLYELGGYRMALLFPMAGAVAAAFAARALARRLAETDGWSAFWLVGLASPILLYALDFWEHSVGVASMGWGVVCFHAAAFPDDEERGLGRLAAACAAGGLLFGVAATMRSEAFVYVLVTTGITCASLLSRRRELVSPLVGGATAVVAFLPPIVLNALLEEVVLGSTMRAGRSVNVASAPAEDVATRAKEAIVTGLSLHPSFDGSSFVIAVALLLLLLLLVRKATSAVDPTPAKIVAGAVVVLYLLRFAGGPGFVPGLLAATPIAAVALVSGWTTSRTRFVVLVALLSLPLVWAFQFTGGAAPQWAGRYVLPSGFLLMVVGVTGLRTLAAWARTFFVLLAVAVTAFGFVWMVQRTHQMAEAQRTLAARPEPVLVSTVAHLPREGGPIANERRWLTATTPEDRAFAASVVADAGFEQFGLVRISDPDDSTAPPEIPGFEAGETSPVPFFTDIALTVTTYTAR